MSEEKSTIIVMYEEAPNFCSTYIARIEVCATVDVRNSYHIACEFLERKAVLDKSDYRIISATMVDFIPDLTNIFDEPEIKPKEMTLEEIQKELGYEIKITE